MSDELRLLIEIGTASDEELVLITGSTLALETLRDALDQKLKLREQLQSTLLFNDGATKVRFEIAANEKRS